jgi:hypothetical protein
VIAVAPSDQASAARIGTQLAPVDRLHVFAALDVEATVYLSV